MSEPPKLFIYARKSTDVEDKQVLSIEAQLAELREHAKREHVTIVAEFVEKQSAKAPGRPIFNDMLARLEREEAAGILSWHPDRLARNSLDGGRIIYMLDTGKIAALKFNTFWFEPTPQGKFMLGLAFGQSKYYVDSLAENVKRGMRAKIRQKRYPGLAPFGYINDYRAKKAIVDPERGPLVREAYERYASGKETLDSLRELFAARGFLSSGGKLVGASFLSRVLSNPFYYGHFKWAGEVHEGDHEPIVTKELFDKVQAVIDRRWKWSPRKEHAPSKPFMQLLRCGECGCTITAEIQKGHTYYHCTRKNRMRPKCSQPFMRGELLDAEISGLLAALSLPDGWASQMMARLDVESAEAEAKAATTISELHAEREKVEARLRRLRDALLDGLVERAEFLSEKSSLMSRRKTLDEQIAALMRSSSSWVEPFRQWISEAQYIGSIANSNLLTEKRLLAKKVFGSNLVLELKKARGVAVEPWSLLEKTANSSLLVNVYEAARTYFQRHCSTR